MISADVKQQEITELVAVGTLLFFTRSIYLQNVK